MLDKILKLLHHGSRVGWSFPAAYDAISEGPSITLLLVHLSSYTAMIAIGFLLYKDILAGTIAAITYSALMLVFYMLRKLTNASFDLDDKKFSLTNQETPEPKL